VIGWSEPGSLIKSSMKNYILGVGTSIPPFRVDCSTSARFAEVTSGIDSKRAKQVMALYRRSGIASRGSVLLDCDLKENVVNDFYPPAISPQDRGPTTACRNDRYATEAPGLAVEAAQSALDASDVVASQITHLVTVSCTGFNAPGIDIALIDRLKLPATTQRVQIGFMGCHGAVNGLRAGTGLVAANPSARVLICCVELCSLHYQYGHETERIVTGALFADGAASVVLGDDRASASQWSRPPVGSVQATGSCLVPGSREAMTWQIGDHGYMMTLSPQVPDLIQQHLPAYLDDWLAAQGQSIKSIGGWAVHPGGMRILSAVESALGLDDDELETSRSVLSDHGNMSSATMLFILDRFRERDQPKPWLMLGFGPGLEIEVALIL
jgi:predicted naringenin-chalcone synthase